VRYSVRSGACGIVFAVFAEQLGRAFTSDVELIETCVSLFYVAAVFQVFDGANIVARCVLRGTGDVRYPAVISVTIAWVTTPPSRPSAKRLTVPAGSPFSS